MILRILYFILFCGICHIALLDKKNINFIKKTALIYTGFSFIFSLFCWVFFNENSLLFQNNFTFSWVFFFNYNFAFGVDGLSMFFVLLSTLLIFLCVLGSWSNIFFSVKEFFLCFLFLDLFLVLVFSVTDLLLFYIFFESILIPMFIIIGIWGSRERKIRAVYLFFFYTLIGSLLMLLGIIYLYWSVGSTNYEVLFSTHLSLVEQKWLWIAFFLSFASKIPLFPLHIWLPEAHVEAPTSGSVLLAGILLKLGAYGFLRFSLPLFPDASLYFFPAIYTLSILGILLTSITAIRQTDFKRIIAYSSVAHMNLVVMGIFSFNFVGISGSVLQSVSHGFVASALFFLIGVLYDRYHSRLILYYSGFVSIMPLYIFLFLFFTMANIALPGTSNFIGEFLILSGIYTLNFFAALLSGLGIVLSGCYSLWVYNRIAYGNIKSVFLKQYSDLSMREFFVFLPLFIGTLSIGIFPNSFLNVINVWSITLLPIFI